MRLFDRAEVKLQRYLSDWFPLVSGPQTNSYQGVESVEWLYQGVKDQLRQPQSVCCSLYRLALQAYKPAKYFLGLS